jgi:FKBP-type peptidyl-prolyl cis-trans isomerase SlyD
LECGLICDRYFILTLLGEAPYFSISGEENMSKRVTPKLIRDDLVVSMAYVLTVDGELVDSTEEGESLQFIQGYGSIIPGLEQALYGMAEGERKAIRVPAKDAYGEYDPEQVVPIPMSEFPDDLELEPGLELEMKDNDGDTLYARIVSVGKSRVKMNFNHPLAGQDLDFDITILALRPATVEELEQGFVE